MHNSAVPCSLERIAVAVPAADDELDNKKCGICSWRASHRFLTAKKAISPRAIGLHIPKVHP